MKRPWKRRIEAWREDGSGMRLFAFLISTLIGCLSLTTSLAAKVHAPMYCWIPDFEIAIGCDEDDEGGDDDDASAVFSVPASVATGLRARR